MSDVKSFVDSAAPRSIEAWESRITSWAATEVVMTPNAKQRAGVLTALITVCEHCKEMRNFQSVVEIVRGLQSPPIARLTKTWEELPSKVSSF